MSASTSRYTGISAWLAASARDSSREGVQSDLISSPATLGFLLRPGPTPGPEREGYQRSGGPSPSPLAGRERCGVDRCLGVFPRLHISLHLTGLSHRLL